MIRKETLITRRRQLCQDMGRMAWPDEALAARGCYPPKARQATTNRLTTYVPSRLQV